MCGVLYLLSRVVRGYIVVSFGDGAQLPHKIRDTSELLFDSVTSSLISMGAPIMKLLFAFLIEYCKRSVSFQAGVAPSPNETKRALSVEMEVGNSVAL